MTTLAREGGYGLIVLRDPVSLLIANLSSS